MHSKRYFNRELSYLAFVCRILEVAADSNTPLLEKLRFLTIINSCLDEFFMVRVSDIRKRGIPESSASPDKIPASLLCPKIRKKVEKICDDSHTVMTKTILPRLQKEGISIKHYAELTANERSLLRDFFCVHVLPVITPVVIDAQQEIPYLHNLADYMVITFSEQEQPLLGFAEIPISIDSLVTVDKKANIYITLLDLVASNLDEVFVGHEVESFYQLRITRDWNYELIDDKVLNLLTSIEEISLGEREAVRLEIDKNMPLSLSTKFMREMHLEEIDVYLLEQIQPRNFAYLLQLPAEKLKYKPFNPRLPRRLVNNKNIFSLIKGGDLLVHHPFESFYTVVEFLHEAALDEHTVAIKQTLYRTSDESTIVDSLIVAAENGKKVTAFIELKARFDEKNNILWAKRLEKAGVIVVYGFIHVKTHLKTTIVTRREDEKTVQYVHLSTGNYNSSTAKTYTDIGLFTADEQYGHDLTLLFNILTSYNLTWNEQDKAQRSSSPQFRRLAVAPFNLRDKIISQIENEIKCKQEHGKGLIIAKMNALVDTEIIDKLYLASQAGVEIALVVRGICCLKPQVKGLSENITVSSTVGRFLEHSRIFYFYAGGKKNVFLASADWMPRNMDRRVEVMYPILEKRLQEQIVEFILPLYLNDAESWNLQSNGTYVRKNTKKNTAGAHELLIGYARESGIKSLPYDVAIRHTSTRPVAK